MLVTLAQTANTQVVTDALGYSWRGLGAGQPWSCGREGTYKRFQVSPGEKSPGDGDTQERSELLEWTSGTVPVPYNTNVWVSMAMRIPSGSRMPLDDAHWIILGQFHPTFSAGDNTDLGPCWSQAIIPGDVFVVYTRSAPTTPITYTPAVVSNHLFTMPRDTWVNLVHRMQFSKTGNGQLDSYLNGVQVFTGSPALGYNETVGPYFQHGIYRAPDTAAAVVEYANVEVGTADLTARIASPLPIP